ncbi:MAG: PAS domain S-box protein [Desulfomonile sp.]|nr:PAS domain S-box protein [Desulfomonile sp.]
MQECRSTIDRLTQELEELRRENMGLRQAEADLRASAVAREEALTRANKQLAAILDSISDGFFILDQDTLISYFNKAAEALLHRSSEELIGRNVFDAFPEARGSIFEEMFTRAVKERSPLCFETYFDVEPYTNWYEVRVHPHEEGVAVYFRITTERRRAERSLLKSKDMLKSILSTSPVGLAISHERVMTWVNDAWVKLFGYQDLHDCVGLNTRVLYPSEEEYDRVGELLYPGLETGQVNETDATFVKKDGTIFYALVRMKAIDPTDPAKGVIAAISDMSDRKRAEEALRKSEERLELALLGADLGLWDIHVPSGQVIANQRVLDILGYARDEVEPTVRYWMTLIHPEDRTRAIEKANAHIHGRADYYEDEYRIKTKSGEWKWILSRGKVVERDADYKPLRMTGTWLDVTGRKNAERTLMENEARFRALFENMTNGVAIYAAKADGEDFVFLDMNKAGEVITGRPKSQVVGRRVTEVFPGIKEMGLLDLFRTTWRTGERSHQTMTEYRDQKIHIWVENFVYKLPSGEIVAVFSDETERMQALKALQGSEEKYRLVVENAKEGIIIAQDGMHRFVNPRIVELFGYSEEELLSRPFLNFIHPDDREGMRERHAKRLRGETIPQRYAFRIVTKNGEVKWVEIESVLVSWEGRPAALVFMTEITERLRMEQALKESEEWYRGLVEESFDGIFVQKGTEIVFANSRLCKMLGYNAGELEGQDHTVVYHPDYRKITRERALARMRGEEVISQYEVKLQRKNGSSFDGEISAKAITVKGGPGVHVWVRDISQRKRSEEVQRRLATAVEQAAEAIVVTDTEGIIQYVNPACEKITGYTREEAVGQNPRILKSGQHDRMFYKNMWDTIKRGEVWTGRFINKRKDGSLYQEDATISPVRDSAGNLVNFVAVKRDITEHLELSRQLLQAQKMEAVGTLAGGIAHDFNNLLQVVLGYSELLLTDRRMDPHFIDDLARINRAARTGSDLVRQLLAFSRKSETNPRPLNLNHRIEQVRKLLERTLPKMVEIEVLLKRDLSPIHADPTQVEQILMDLAINARDAMPDGGKLVIETDEVTLDEEYCRTHLGPKPGRFVVLQVSDTGKGMDAETLEHIFEPFYTTKGPGEGTGLGLAMVYGIVQQHEGFIRCYSEPGKGTSFKLYWPAVVSDKDSLEKTALPPFRGGTETILLADDEEFVRDLGIRILEKAGYTVLTASNGKGAVERYIAHRGEIALVILDLIMPEMGGRQCLDQLLSLDPEVKVVVAGGYSASGPTKEVLEAGAKGFVDKPYGMRQLLDTVRSVLDGE